MWVGGSREELGGLPRKKIPGKENRKKKKKRKGEAMGVFVVGVVFVDLLGGCCTPIFHLCLVDVWVC